VRPSDHLLSVSAVPSTKCFVRLEAREGSSWATAPSNSRSSVVADQAASSGGCDQLWVMTSSSRSGSDRQGFQTSPVGEGRPLSAASARSGMSENTGRKYRREGGLAAREPRKYRTRKDPFEAVWPEIEKLLEEAPGLEAQSVFEALR
jgi:hypothetical protein